MGLGWVVLLLHMAFIGSLGGIWLVARLGWGSRVVSLLCLAHCAVPGPPHVVSHAGLLDF